MYTKRVHKPKGWEAIFTDRRSVSPETEILHGSDGDRMGLKNEILLV